MGPSRLYGDTCEQMLKFREGQGLGPPESVQNRDFLDRKPAGDLAATCPDHMVSLSALKTEIQPSSLTIFIFASRQKNMNTNLFGHPLNPRALGTAPVEKSAKICSG